MVAEPPTHRLAAANLLASGKFRSIRLRTGDDELDQPLPRSALELRVPFSVGEHSCSTRPVSIDDVEHGAATLRRKACARSASARASAGGESAADSDLDEADETVEESTRFLSLSLESPSIASSIGGKVWDASLLLSSWIAERRHELRQRADATFANGEGEILLEHLRLDVY